MLYPQQHTVEWYRFQSYHLTSFQEVIIFSPVGVCIVGLTMMMMITVDRHLECGMSQEKHA
jgi:hypothetical protein